MESISIAIYDILNTDAARYRIIHIIDNRVVACQMDISKLMLCYFSLNDIKENIISGNMTLEKDEGEVVDLEKFCKELREKFLSAKSCMQEIVACYGPTYMGLMGKGSKPEAVAIMEKYKLKPFVFWKMVRTYLQSGCKESSLVDRRAYGKMPSGDKIRYTVRTGRPTLYGAKNQVIVDDTIRAYFNEAISYYKKGRQTTIKGCYEDMIHRHFMRQAEKDGVYKWEMMPEEQIPSFTQFYNYLKKHLTIEEKDRIRTSAAEQRNNKRLLLSDSMKNVHGPGDTVEIDALETDVSLVSERDRSQTIGRGILYLMIDVWTRVILAMSVSFENNSVLGCTNLFMNLADDKKEYAEKYGVAFTEGLWPSNVIPRRVRVDRGADFRSDKLSAILNKVGIERLLEPAATGSYKGIVEQEFHQIQFNQNEILENNGLIEKRHDSQHHKEATLTIHEFTALCIHFVLTHNQKYLQYYKQDKKMQDAKIEPIPIKLWAYGCQRYGSPRPIADKSQYLWNLLTPTTASLNREGLKWKGLYYLNVDDTELLHEMYGQETKVKKMEVRFDPRDIGSLYYLRNNKLMIAPLNMDKFGSQGFSGMTYAEYCDYFTAKKVMSKKGERHNRNISINERTMNKNIVDSVRPVTYADPSMMREERNIEKNDHNRQNALIHHLEKEEEKPEITTRDTNVIEDPGQVIDDDMSFEEALRIFHEEE